MQQSVFIKSLRREPVSRTPVWVMRQAGRYLPEYRKIRAKVKDFLVLCKTPDLACEVTLQPLRRFDLDAAILFSDILTIPHAMGMDLSFVEGEGPRFSRPIRHVREIQALPSIDVGDHLSYVMETVRLARQSMPSHIPLIGFSGSPWTLACYMIEGQGSKTFKEALRFLYLNPEGLHVLLQKLTETIIVYLEEQILHGANAIMLFDTWGGLLSTVNFMTFSQQYMSKIVKQLKLKHPEVPVIVFTKGGGQWLQILADSGCDALGLDWTTDLGRARAQVGTQVALQGNLDPVVLLTNPDCIRTQVQALLASYGFGSGHVFNLGHGITPDVPPEHLSVMVQAVAEFSPMYHAYS